MRDLQHRAHAALASSRERAARLEAQITQQLDALDAALNEQIALDSKSAADADTFQADIARLTGELKDSRAAWLIERAELESQAVALSQQLDAANVERDDLAQKLTDLESQHADLRQKVSQLEAHTGDLSPKVVSLEAERNDLAKRITELESQRDALSLKAAGLESERDELTENTSSSEGQRDQLTKQVADLEQERDELAAKTATLESQIQASQADWRKQLLDFENRLCEQQAAWNEQRTESAKSRTTIEGERDELQQKFDLALEDLQRLRGKVAELEQDLSRRPEASAVDSAEWAAA